MPASASRSCATRTMSWAKPMGLGAPVWRAVSPISLMSTASSPTCLLRSTRVHTPRKCLPACNKPACRFSPQPSPARGKEHNVPASRRLVAYRHRGEVTSSRYCSVGLLKIFVGKAVEMGPSHKNLHGDVARDRAQQVTRHVGEVGVEVWVVRGDTHPIGTNKASRWLNLRLAPFHRGPAVAPEVFLRREGEIRRVRVAVLGIVPLDACQDP